MVKILRAGSQLARHYYFHLPRTEVGLFQVSGAGMGNPLIPYALHFVKDPCSETGEIAVRSNRQLPTGPFLL